MRKLAVALALASTALASPTLARDKQFYVGGDFGAMIIEDIHFDIGTTPNASVLNHKYGFDGDGNVGYDFGGFRVEAEVGYRQAYVDGYRNSLNTAFFNANGTLGSSTPGTFNYAGGRSSALSFMLNGLLDFGADDEIQGFVGGGAGVARVKERIGITSYGYAIDDSDTRFAYQGIAGVRAPLGPHLDVSLKYRFFNVDKVRLVSVTNANYTGRFRSHSILGGIAYNFGEPPAPPPPPVVAEPPAPPPQAAPPPPPPVCAPGPFIVFFEWNKSDVTPEAASILDNAVSQYANCGNAQVMLAGFTDTSGTPRYNVGLSQRRAASVRAYMAGHGIPDGVIQTQAFGEDPGHLRVQTADGVREVQNRRVEIMYGPGAGAGQ